jgi:transcriptional regulator with XRE-family HTH domain
MSADPPETDQAEHASIPHHQLTLAQKLARLFATKHPAHRGPYTLREVADLVTQQELCKQELSASSPRVKISFSYLSQLRTGASDNPSFKQLAALAEVFGVPITYFTGPAPEVDRIDADLAVYAAMQNSAVRDLAVRASSLTPAGLRVLDGVLASVEDVPGLASHKARAATEDAGV